MPLNILLLLLFFLIFFLYTPEAYAASCTIDLQYKTPLVRSSVINGIVKSAINNPLGQAISSCNYEVTINKGYLQMTHSTPGSQTFVLGPSLEPGKYTVNAKVKASLIGPLQGYICGQCSASFEVFSGTEGLTCLMCPNNYYYAPLYKNCVKNGESQWQTGNPNPIDNCPGQCIEETGKCGGDPIQPAPSGTTPTLSCCSAGFEYNPQAKTCKATAGSGHGTLLCKSGYECNPTSQKCEPKRFLNIPQCSDQDILTGKCTTAAGQPCGGDPNNPGIATAIGCIHTQPVALARDLVKFTMAIAGGTAFLMMLAGAFQMITSAGNPETLKAGTDRFTNAIIGLLFIIFSTLLLQIIGVDILEIFKLS